MSSGKQKRAAQKYINMLLFDENCTRFVVDKSSLQFAKLFCLLVSVTKKTLWKLSTNPEHPMGATPAQGERGATRGWIQAQPQL